MQVFFSHAIEDQDIANEIRQRLTKISSIREVVTDIDLPKEKSPGEKVLNLLACEYYFWLISNSHTSPKKFSQFDEYYQSIGKKNSMICIHLEDCKFLDASSSNIFLHLPLKNKSLTHLDSIQWDDKEEALTEVVNQIIQTIQKNEAKKGLELHYIGTYLNLLGNNDGSIIKPDPRGRGILVNDQLHRILFVPISFQKEEETVKLIKEFANYGGQDIDQFFFFPMDPFEAKNISIRNIQEKIDETISWIQSKNLVEKLFVVNTCLLNSKDKKGKIQQEQKPKNISRKKVVVQQTQQANILDELLKMIDDDMTGAFERMDKLNWGKFRGDYNDIKKEWIDPPIGFNKSDFRSRLKVLINNHFNGGNFLK